MIKPSLRVVAFDDEDSVEDRIVRALQDSALHLFALDCLVDDPEEPGSGRCIALTLSAISDGTRGFLVVCDDYCPPRSADELEALMVEVYEGDDARGEYATAVASCWPGERPGPGVLDLNHGPTARATLERAYEAAFAGAPPIDHARFFERFTAIGFRFDDETKRRASIDFLDRETGVACQLL